MNTLELKGNILNLIANIEDVQLLTRIEKNLYKLIKQEKVDWWDELPVEVQNRILKAKKIADNQPELLKPHSEVKKKYEKYLD